MELGERGNTRIVVFAGLAFVLCAMLHFLPSFKTGKKVLEQKKAAPLSAGKSEGADREAYREKESSLRGVAKRLSESYPPLNNIERARNATVTIKTPWGSGTGFFINGDCDVITNRHVVEFGESGLDKVKGELAKLETFVKREEGQLEELEREMANSADRTFRQQFSEHIAQRRERLDKARGQWEEGMSKIQGIEEGADLGNITVTLIDGSEYETNTSTYSDNFDLALINLGDFGCPFIEKGPYTHLAQGNTVYSIGNPVGLSHTVTAGIFSGLREMKKKVYIQTDAPINPGNSGGPLINKEGRVVGVNTMILKDTEGIGFAIPIDRVYEEFSLEP